MVTLRNRSIDLSFSLNQKSSEITELAKAKEREKQTLLAELHKVKEELESTKRDNNRLENDSSGLKRLAKEKEEQIASMQVRRARPRGGGWRGRGTGVQRRCIATAGQIHRAGVQVPDNGAQAAGDHDPQPGQGTESLNLQLDLC
jgi:hypothetical protein